ncbi:ribonuclease domain-containing protein [Streptomyces sp. NPDC017179]|uniref:ribonuclease domain-containing protein n=1 Tax=Streptomyces sp. NPDC017179 TaxID=3364979 RepID=UPI0037B03DBA
MLLRFVPRVFAGILVTFAVLLTGCSPSGQAGSDPSAPSWAHGMATISQSRLPAEARQTLDLIDRGGPYPYRQDNTVFGNFEGRLPKEPRGYYHEYTVRTPGSRDRGARRVVVGQGGEFYYTDDHYNTFRAVLR